MAVEAMFRVVLDDADTEAQAYFSPAGNEIVVPGGIMQPPVYYGPRLPSYLTYGAFGALMGHEISHGKAPIRSCFVSSIDQPAFDSMGRYFDANGNKTDWWDPQTSAQYAQRSRCFIDQYNEFGAAGPDGGLLFVDGAQTLDENLADDRGLRAAFQAWRTRDKKDPDKKIVGLDRFSKEQIFFLSYGSFWCSKSQAETMQKYLRSNVHAPDFARIMVSQNAFSHTIRAPRLRKRCMRVPPQIPRIFAQLSAAPQPNQHARCRRGHYLSWSI